MTVQPVLDPHNLKLSARYTVLHTFDLSEKVKSFKRRFGVYFTSQQVVYVKSKFLVTSLGLSIELRRVDEVNQQSVNLVAEAC